MRLTRLEIKLNVYGENEGKYTGVAQFTGDAGSVALNLNQHHCEQMFLVCADGIVDVAKAAARMFVQEAMGTIAGVKAKELANHLPAAPEAK